jgi:hypothetical protein
MSVDSFLGALRRLVFLLKRGGIAYTFVCFLRKLSPQCVRFGSVTFFVQDLAFNLPEHGLSLDVGMHRYSSISLGDLKECDRSFSEEMLRDRKERGDVCYVALDSQDKIVHSHWVSITSGYIPELDLELVLGGAEAYMYNSMTRPDLRGRGLFAGVRNFLVKDLNAEGLKRIFFYVRGDNCIGLRSESRWLRTAGKFWYFQVRGLRPLVFGRRSSELPVLRKVGSAEAEHGVPSLRPVYPRLLALLAFMLAVIGRETLDK